jgi:putative membrane protein
MCAPAEGRKTCAKQLRIDGRHEVSTPPEERTVTESRGRAIVLWTIAFVFAVFTILTSVFPSLLSPGPVGIINTILLVAFALVHGVATYGGRGIVFFVLVCLVVSNIFENLSIITGFPFGHYHYTEILGPKIFLVPITIGGAYFGAGYLSWIISLVLLGRMNQPIDRFARWTLPVVASFLMASWDFMLDPGASTVEHNWIWENGGGFFGVPFSNYLGWLLTVFVFFAIFSGYAAVRSQSALQGIRHAPEFYAQAIIMYALLGVRHVLTYFVPTENSRLVDAVGHPWMSHDIYETAALAAIFTVFAFSILAGLRLADPKAPFTA